MMRVTTQMLDNTARKGGIMLTGRSLLDYVSQGSGSMAGGLLEALDKGGSIADPVKKSSYEKMEKEADALLKNAGLFVPEKDTLFDKAKESKDNNEIYDAAEALAESFNNTLNALQSSSSTVDRYYWQMLQEAAVENKEALENIGITFAKDGTMVLDKEKLRSSDIDSLEKALGPSNVFAAKLAVLADRISSNAAANAESYSSQYNSFGDIYSSVSSKYDFWG